MVRFALPLFAALALAGSALAADPPVRIDIQVTPDAGVERLARKGEALTATMAQESVDAITTSQRAR